MTQSTTQEREITTEPPRAMVKAEPEEVQAVIAPKEKKPAVVAAPEKPSPKQPAIEPEKIEPSPAAAVMALQQQALQLQSEGQWQQAELKLERALRIDADKSDLYHQLATVRMGQQRFAQAEQIALKGLTLTNQSAQHKATLWEVIAQCRSAQSDIAGAKQARQQMQHWLAN